MKKMLCRTMMLCLSAAPLATFAQSGDNMQQDQSQDQMQQDQMNHDDMKKDPNKGAISAGLKTFGVKPHNSAQLNVF